MKGDTFSFLFYVGMENKATKATKEPNETNRIENVCVFSFFFSSV